MAQKKKVTPFLWFDDQAEEAVNFYASIFKDSHIGKITRYGKNAPRPEGMVMTISFELGGQEFTALNGGPQYKFNEAVSFQISCDSQDEVDHYWEKLSEGGEEGPCGWLTDKYGMAWQVTPVALTELLSDSDPAKVERVMEAAMQMKKIEIEPLQQAYDGVEQGAE